MTATKIIRALIPTILLLATFSAQAEARSCAYRQVHHFPGVIDLKAKRTSCDAARNVADRVRWYWMDTQEMPEWLGRWHCWHGTAGPERPMRYRCWESKQLVTFKLTS